MARDYVRPALVGGESLRENVERPAMGGKKFYPQDITEARRNLRPQVERLQQQAAEIPPSLRARKLFFEAVLLPNFLASSYFPDTILERTGLVPVGSRSARGVLRTAQREVADRPTKALLLAGEDGAVQQLADLLQDDTGAPLTALAQLTELAEVRFASDPEVIRRMPQDVGAGEVVTWEAVLHRAPGRNSREIREIESEIFEKFQAHVEALGGEVAADYRRVIEGVAFVPIALPVEAIREAARFNPLRAVRPMPKLRPIVIGPLRAACPVQTVLAPAHTAAVSASRIAVFDGGIDPACPVTARPFVRLINESPEPPDPRGLAHGSLVTNAVLYGNIDPTKPLPQPPVTIDHYRVYPVPQDERMDLELNWVLDCIVAAVRANQYPMINLSLGPDECVDEDDEPHRWTAELDALSAQTGTLIVSAVGNNGDSAPEFNRIQVPADMVNGLSVGACTAHPPQRNWDRAPYSACGPGRWGSRVKPTLVAFGGDAGAHPFVGVGPGGRLIQGNGTSFATPLVTHGVASLFGAAAMEGASAAMLRALAVHAAERRTRHHREQEHGFGRFPQRLDDRLECGEDEVTVLYDDEIGRDETVALEIPFPEGVPGEMRVKIRWTLCFTAPVDPSDATDYTRAGMEVTFRPHANMYAVIDDDTSDRIAVLDVIRERERLQELLAGRAHTAANPQAFSGTTIRNSEQGRRESGKWDTTIHTTVSRPASTLYRPRLDLRYYARAAGALVRDGVEGLPYALVVTVRTAGASRLYSRVRSQFGMLVPITQRIQARV